jgi:four helix bundle protein
MKPYERLDAWNACHEVVLAIYRATKAFPKDEQYGLASQLRLSGHFHHRQHR